MMDAIADTMGSERSSDVSTRRLDFRDPTLPNGPLGVSQWGQVCSVLLPESPSR